MNPGLLILVKLIGVNKGRHVTFKYFSILINVSRKHRVYLYRSWTKHKFNLDSCEINISKEDNGKHVRIWKITTVINLVPILTQYADAISAIPRRPTPKPPFVGRV